MLKTLWVEHHPWPLVWCHLLALAAWLTPKQGYEPNPTLNSGPSGTLYRHPPLIVTILVTRNNASHVGPLNQVLTGGNLHPETRIGPFTGGA